MCASPWRSRFHVGPAVVAEIIQSYKSVVGRQYTRWRRRNVSISSACGASREVSERPQAILRGGGSRKITPCRSAMCDLHAAMPIAWQQRARTIEQQRWYHTYLVRAGQRYISDCAPHCHVGGQHCHTVTGG